MSSFAEKRELKKQIAAATKAGKSNQTIGRLQYKLNQLNKDSKGSAVKTKSGVVKSKTGVVRQTDASKKKTKKRGPDFYKEAVALDRKKSTGPTKRPVKTNRVKVTPLASANITKSKLPSSGKSPKYSFSMKEDYSKVPRITGKLPAVADQTRREQLEAFRRRLNK